MSIDKPKETAEPSAKNPRRGIYLLPNLLTTGAMFGGFYAILSAMNGHFEQAAIAIFVAMFFDGLDGQVARMTNTQSDFGVQYDSLSDMVSFGVAPAVLSFSWMLHSLGKVGWAAAFIYASCAALRLARFNTQIDVVDKRYFIGLASPTAAALVAGLVWNGFDAEPAKSTAIMAAIVTSAAGILMVSNFRYKSLKGLDLKGRVPFMVIIAIVLVVVVISIDPPAMLLLLALTYTLSAPLFWLFRWVRTRRDGTKDKKLKPAATERFEPTYARPDVVTEDEAFFDDDRLDGDRLDDDRFDGDRFDGDGLGGDRTQDSADSSPVSKWQNTRE